MTEFGKSPLLDAATLTSLGVNVVIYPVTTLRLAMGAVEEGLRAIAADGTQEALVGRMQTRSRLYDLLGYAELLGPRRRRLRLLPRRPRSAMSTSTPDDPQGPGRRRRRPHRDLERRARDQLAHLPRLPGAGARGHPQLRGGGLPDLVRRAPGPRRARRAVRPRAVPARAQPQHDRPDRAPPRQLPPDGRAAQRGERLRAPRIPPRTSAAASPASPRPWPCWRACPRSSRWTTAAVTTCRGSRRTPASPSRRTSSTCASARSPSRRSCARSTSR